MKVLARDVYGQPLPVPHDIWFERAGTSRGAQVARMVRPGGHAGFKTDTAKQYRARVEPAWGYCHVGANVDGARRVLEVKVPIHPDQVKGYEWPVDMGEVTALGADVENLSERQLGTLLNLWAKLWRTTVAMAPAATYVERIVEVRNDRIICEVDRALPGVLTEEVAVGTFIGAPSALHHPPTGYDRGVSIKTKEKSGVGNLQISTFIRDPAVGTGAPVLADVDIDENLNIFLHAFDVAKHALTGEETNHVHVQQLLVAHQDIDPGWRPLVAAPGSPGSVDVT